MAEVKDSNKDNHSPREEIINTAVNFLRNPKVQRSSLNQKQAFLKSKGLSDEEIRIACERSAISAAKQKINTGSLVGLQNGVSPAHATISQSHSSWQKFRDTANVIVLIGGASYGLYILYKKYISPWCFGGGNEKTIEQSILDLDNALAASVQELRDSLNKVHADLKSFREQRSTSSSEAPATVKQIEELKAEIASVKGLLLNRSQFAPPAVTKSPLLPPSIPAWQLSSKDGEKSEESQSIKGDADIDDICLSGSGSSETEMVTNNGSDSSLEMIRE